MSSPSAIAKGCGRVFLSDGQYDVNQYSLSAAMLWSSTVISRREKTDKPNVKRTMSPDYDGPSYRLGHFRALRHSLVYFRDVRNPLRTQIRDYNTVA